MLLKNSNVFGLLMSRDMLGGAYDPYNMIGSDHVIEEYYNINKFYPDVGVAITMAPTGEMEMAAYTDKQYEDLLFYGGVDAMITVEFKDWTKCTRFDLI